MDYTNGSLKQELDVLLTNDAEHPIVDNMTGIYIIYLEGYCCCFCRFLYIAADFHFHSQMLNTISNRYKDAILPVQEITLWR